MVFAHFLVDVLVILVQLSMCLQKRKCCIHEVHQELEAALTNIKKLETNPGYEQRMIQAALEGNQGMFEGEILTGNAKDVDDQVTRVAQQLKKKLENRFTDVSQGLLSASKIADLHTWPPTYDEAISFGDDLVASIIDHYRDHLLSHRVEVGAVEAEWTILKQALYDTDSDTDRCVSQLEKLLV
ncbi:PREDICTED: uncharacterized protein LOC106812205 [Priapulus caudatus]|uniref:Uncharacterized protein LOC106812205 n=1 Tax=Priapulus caudatus TaxID=37621 RepID=A0ABM1EH44_PRICU|nr:PREDICTED: uncharacterized protein LOC106812205 [Priapulus caudatus]